MIDNDNQGNYQPGNMQSLEQQQPDNYGAIDGNHSKADQEQGSIEEERIIDKALRKEFIKKVYGILCAQLFLTAIMCVISCSVPSFAKFQQTHVFLSYFFGFVSVIILLVLFCSRNVSKTVPTNYILLTIFTLLEGYSVSMICSVYDKQTVLLAALFTFDITLELTIYTFTTKTDFTVFTGVLLVCLICLIFFGIACLIIRARILNIMYCAFGVLIFGIYIVCDTQLLIGNKSKKIEMDEYIFGAVNLYLDIINIFIYILSLLGDRR